MIMVDMQLMGVDTSPEYDKQFWNYMTDRKADLNLLDKAKNASAATYNVPMTTSNKLEEQIRKESVIRKIASVINAKANGYKIAAVDCKDIAQYVREGDELPLYDGMDDFDSLTVDSHKLVSFIKLGEDFVHDATFDIEKYLVKRFGRCIAKGEDRAFICGTGENEPTGILDDKAGAMIGLESTGMTFDDVISLYFSVDSEYRSRGVWLMNDSVALELRALKDSAGNYLWNSANDTILGKPVIISDSMPDAEKGSKPIAFGDFSYYWVIRRKPVSMKMLKEAFVTRDQLGYLAVEYLDGKLVRREAIKVLLIAE